MKKNRDTVGVEKNKKTSSNAELQADKAKDEQPKASQKSDEGRRFTVSQRLIISVMVVVCVAVLVYIGLEVVIRSVDARNEREFDRRVDSCADYAGNCWFVGHSIYLSEKGNKNPRPKEQRSVSIFERTSVVSSCILRELFADVTKIWKLKYLSEKVNCSIGQVSKLMKVLVENAWVEKLPDGYKVIDPEALLLEWSRDYGKKEITSYACYSLDTISVIEERLKKLKIDMGIDSYLTGLSGGVRYTPVVRYNKVHVYIAPEDIKDAIRYLDMKEVNSGANVVIFPLENDSYIKDYRVIDGSAVVSPLQIYLDCMQIKGRGEEMADAVLKKEILRW